MLLKIKKRLKEPTTWLGLSVIATMLGVPPDVIAAGYKLVSILAATGGIVLPENSN